MCEDKPDELIENGIPKPVLSYDQAGRWEWITPGVIVTTYNIEGVPVSKEEFEKYAEEGE